MDFLKFKSENLIKYKSVLSCAAEKRKGNIYTLYKDK